MTAQRRNLVVATADFTEATKMTCGLHQKAGARPKKPSGHALRCPQQPKRGVEDAKILHPTAVAGASCVVSVLRAPKCHPLDFSWTKRFSSKICTITLTLYFGLMGRSCTSRMYKIVPKTENHLRW